MTQGIKVVVITGASSGLGQASAWLLCARGAARLISLTKRDFINHGEER